MPVATTHIQVFYSFNFEELIFHVEHDSNGLQNTTLQNHGSLIITICPQVEFNS